MLDPFAFVSHEHGFLRSGNLKKSTLNDQPILNKICQIAEELPTLISRKQLRSVVNRLNETNIENQIQYHLLPTSELELIGLALRFITQAYIWETPQQPAASVPAVIAIPNYHLSKYQKRFPALTYEDYVLNNWQFIANHHIVSLETVAPIFTFTGIADESWFILIHTNIEAVSGAAIKAAFHCCQHAYSAHPSIDMIIVYLNIIRDSISKATTLLNLMPERCRPTFYSESLRYYLSGWEMVRSVNNQQGIHFEGVTLYDKPAQFSYKGPSGAQSSIMPALDCALGVQHEIDHLYQTLLTFQQYMPSKHVMLIHYFQSHPIASFILKSNDNRLKNAWQQAVTALKNFRNAHIDLVNTYIYQPNELKGIKASTMVGTGGTIIKDYLEKRLLSTQ